MSRRRLQQPGPVPETLRKEQTGLGTDVGSVRRFFGASGASSLEEATTHPRSEKARRSTPGRQFLETGLLRALSEPLTAETGDVVWICTEDEYKKAHWENREAVGVPWTLERMRLSSSLPWRLSYR